MRQVLSSIRMHHPPPERAETTPQRTPQRGWAGMAERGSIRALQVLRWLYRRLGRRGRSPR